VITFTLDIIPPKTTAQQKRAVSLPGKGIRFFKTKAQEQAENSYMALVYPHRPAKPLQGPVRVYVRFSLPWRKSEPKRNRVDGWKWSDTRPDVDNMAKALLDVMGECGFWGDDSQIASLTLEKQWGEWTGVIVEVTQL